MTKFETSMQLWCDCFWSQRAHTYGACSAVCIKIIDCLVHWPRTKTIRVTLADFPFNPRRADLNGCAFVTGALRAAPHYLSRANKFCRGSRCLILHTSEGNNCRMKKLLSMIIRAYLSETDKPLKDTPKYEFTLLISGIISLSGNQFYIRANGCSDFNRFPCESHNYLIRNSPCI